MIASKYSIPYQLSISSSWHKRKPFVHHQAWGAYLAFEMENGTSHEQREARLMRHAGYQGLTHIHPYPLVLSMVLQPPIICKRVLSLAKLAMKVCSSVLLMGSAAI